MIPPNSNQNKTIILGRCHSCRHHLACDRQNELWQQSQTLTGIAVSFSIQSCDQFEPTKSRQWQNFAWTITGMNALLTIVLIKYSPFTQAQAFGTWGLLAFLLILLSLSAIILSVLSISTMRKPRNNTLLINLIINGFFIIIGGVVLFFVLLASGGGMGH